MNIWNKTKNHYPRLDARISDAKADQQMRDALKYWRDEYARLQGEGAIGLHPVALTGDYMRDGIPCSAAVQTYRYQQSLRKLAELEAQPDVEPVAKLEITTDPRTPEQLDVDAWQVETRETREQDFPR